MMKMAVLGLKLKQEDIRFLSEGQQIEKAILRKYKTMREFAEIIGMRYETVRKYLRQANGGSGDFKQLLIQELQISYFEIVLSKQQQIIRLVDQVARNIRDYKDDEDLQVLEALRKLCSELNLNLDKAKMHRAIGMYYFHRNDINTARNLLQVAIDMVRTEKAETLLAAYCSELGLICFYNCDYAEAKSNYEEVQRMMMTSTGIDRKTQFLHYYRYGLLFSSRGEYELAKPLLLRAVSCADEKHDLAMAVMNIGILHRRQNNLKEALKHYRQALTTLDKNDYMGMNAIYNNMADVYKLLGQFERALSYINWALANFDRMDDSRSFIVFGTYTEIKLLMGEPEAAFDKFLELLSKVHDLQLHKTFIINAVNSIIRIENLDQSILDGLKDVVIKLIHETAKENEEYRLKLTTCLGSICLRKKAIRG